MTTIQEPDILRTEFTPAEQLRFFRNPQGFLALELNGTTHARVQLNRALPLTAPTRYICVTDMDDKELAVIEDIDALSEENRALVGAELDLRYYYPVVTDVRDIKEKLGAYYLSVSIGDYEKNVAVKDISKNMRQLGGGALILTDVDGNRFHIPNVYEIRRKCLRVLEPYLY